MIHSFSDTEAKENAGDRPAIDPNRVYLTNEAAHVLGVRPSTIRAFVRAGKLSARGRPYRLLGRQLLATVGGAA